MESSKSSIVSDLISFEPKEDVSWHRDGVSSCSKMIQEIIHCHKEFLEMPNDSEHIISSVKDKFIQDYAIKNTDPPKDIEKRDTKNLMKLLSWLDGEVYANESPLDILMEVSIVQDGHKTLMKGAKIKEGCAKPGEFSDRPKYTTFKGEKYDYPELSKDAIYEKVLLLIDRFNSLYNMESLSKSDPAEKLLSVFKSLSYFLFEILDLHPFGDGNGRLFRVFCSQFLSPFTPFPSPIYFPCSDVDHSLCKQPCKHIYEEALVEARKSNTRHPRKLVSMIIYCNCKTWKEFLCEIHSQISSRN